MRTQVRKILLGEPGPRSREAIDPASDVNINFWKYALPLLATAVAAAVGIWLQPQPPARSPPQTVASSTHPAPATDDCRSQIGKPSGAPPARLDRITPVCREPAR
jgi:hypothetical protein